MRHAKSFTSGLKTTPYNAQLKSEAYISYGNPTDTPVRELEVPPSTRFQHIYIGGASQHGKSTLMEHMITQDMENGEGLTLLDPKGDLAELVVNRVPAHRISDCIYIDIKDPVPINFMGWETEHERQTLVADVTQTFMKFSAMPPGDQWGSILQWTIYTLLASKSASFLDIYYFLARPETRQKEILQAVAVNNFDGQYDDIFHYWAKDFPKLGKPREGPILTRMSTLITTPSLRKMLGHAEKPVDIFECMETRKILIVNLMGAGRPNGSLIGTLLTSKIQQAAFRRQAQPKALRIPHFFYADEFQNFQTSDFDVILEEAGGFRLSLTLANQGLYQLRGDNVKEAVLTNVTAARIAFRLSHRDVSEWKHLMTDDPDDPNYVDPYELARLPRHKAFFKIGTEVGLIRPTPLPLPHPSPDQIRNAKTIKYETLKTYPAKKLPSAESSQKRKNVPPSCNSDQMPHDEGNGINYDQIKPKVEPPKDEHR